MLAAAISPPRMQAAASESSCTLGPQPFQPFTISGTASPASAEPAQPAWPVSDTPWHVRAPSLASESSRALAGPQPFTISAMASPTAEPAQLTRQVSPSLSASANSSRTLSHVPAELQLQQSTISASPWAAAQLPQPVASSLVSFSPAAVPPEPIAMESDAGRNPAAAPLVPAVASRTPSEPLQCGICQKPLIQSGSQKSLAKDAILQCKKTTCKLKYHSACVHQAVASGVGGWKKASKKKFVCKRCTWCHHCDQPVKYGEAMRECYKCPTYTEYHLLCAVENICCKFCQAAH